MGNCPSIKIRVLSIIGSVVNIKVIFEMYIFLQIFEKRELCENMYNAKIIYIYDHSICQIACSV